MNLNNNDYTLICLTDPKESNKLVFDIKLNEKWYSTVFKDGIMVSVQKSTTRGEPEEINKNKLDWWDISQEMELFINKIILQWYKENDVYIPKFDTVDRITMLGEFHLNMPKIEAVNLTNANLMITHLLNLFYLDKQEELVQCIDVYIKKLKNNEGSIDKISFFDEIDNMIKSNISKMNDKYINKTALIRQNDSLRYIKELVLNKGEK